MPNGLSTHPEYPKLISSSKIQDLGNFLTPSLSSYVHENLLLIYPMLTFIFIFDAFSTAKLSSIHVMSLSQALLLLKPCYRIKLSQITNNGIVSLLSTFCYLCYSFIQKWQYTHFWHVSVDFFWELIEHFFHLKLVI